MVTATVNLCKPVVRRHRVGRRWCLAALGADRCRGCDEGAQALVAASSKARVTRATARSSQCVATSLGADSKDHGFFFGTEPGLMTFSVEPEKLGGGALGIRPPSFGWNGGRAGGTALETVPPHSSKKVLLIR